MATFLSPAEICAIRHNLNLSEVEFGRALKLDNPRKKVRELENGSRVPSPQMIALMHALLRIRELEHGAESH
jgi:DNA-binding transcriptional regulator YiaG